jgi:hypothetical protein
MAVGTGLAQLPALPAAWAVAVADDRRGWWLLVATSTWAMVELGLAASASLAILL